LLPKFFACAPALAGELDAGHPREVLIVERGPQRLDLGEAATGGL
jgi:hypothetical protein